MDMQATEPLSPMHLTPRTVPLTGLSPPLCVTTLPLVLRFNWVLFVALMRLFYTTGYLRPNNIQIARFYPHLLPKWQSAATVNVQLSKSPAKMAVSITISPLFCLGPLFALTQARPPVRPEVEMRPPQSCGCRRERLAHRSEDVLSQFVSAGTTDG